MHVCVHVRSLQCVRFFGTPRTVACQSPLSTGFSRQEYWSGLPFPPPEDLPNPGIKPASLVSPALAGGSLPLAPPEKPHIVIGNGYSTGPSSKGLEYKKADSTGGLLPVKQ